MKTAYRLLGVVGSISILALLQSGCGSSSNTSATANSPPATTAATPSTPANPQGSSGSSGSGTESIGWIQLEETTTCEAMDPTFCVGNYGFLVKNDGRYVAGVQLSDGALTGSVTPTELATLNTQANAVAANTMAGLSCAPSLSIPGVTDNVTMVDGNGSSIQIYNAQIGQQCTSGDAATTTAMHDTLRTLMRKYYTVPLPAGASGASGI